MKQKNYEPIKDMILFQSDWEKVMNGLQDSPIKYTIQCMIDTAIRRGEWK